MLCVAGLRGGRHFFGIGIPRERLSAGSVTPIRAAAHAARQSDIQEAGPFRSGMKCIRTPQNPLTRGRGAAARLPPRLPHSPLALPGPTFARQRETSPPSTGLVSTHIAPRSSAWRRTASDAKAEMKMMGCVTPISSK